MLEVELKFRLDDETAFRDRLNDVGAQRTGDVSQRDAYYNHPSRDFAVTDEALRIRTVGDDSVVTYKGPKEGKLAKTRFELELPLAPTTAAGWGEVLTKLGFRRVATVTKRRESFRLQRDGRPFELSIDTVEGLGVFAEVETLAEEPSLDSAEHAVTTLAGELGLSRPESKSYLELLLAE